MPRYVGQFMLVWLPEGIAVFALLRYGLGCWPGIVLGSLVVTRLDGGNWAHGVAVAAANTAGACLTVALLNRWRFDSRFRRPCDILWLSLASAAGMVVTAIGGTAGLSIFRGVTPGDVPEAVISWWVSGTFGILLFTPLLLAFHQDNWAALTARPREFLFWALATFTLGPLLFFNDVFLAAKPLPVESVGVVLAVWGALRFGLVGVSSSVFAISCFAILGRELHLGPFVHSSDIRVLVHLSSFTLTVVFVGWLVWSLSRSRERTEEKLRSSLASADLTARGSTDGFWDWDITRDRTNNPERWLGQLGYEASDMDGVPTRAFFDRLVHPDDRAMVSGRLRQHLEERVPYSVEFRLRAKDGSYRWILSRGQALWDSEGRATRMAGSHEDITDRLKQEAHLRLLEASLARLNDIVMICEADPFEEPGPRIVFVNDSFTRVTGYSRAEAMGRNPRFLQGPDTSAATRREIEQAIREGRAVSAELVNYRKNGEAFWLDINVVPVSDAKGRISHFVSVQRETTERRQAEAALRESEARYQRVNRGTNDGVWEWNLVTNEEYCSPRWLEMLGMAALDQPGNFDAFSKMIHPDDLPRVMAASDRSLRTGEPFRAEMRLHLRDGSYLWVLSRALVERDAAGKPLRMTGSISDITERKRAEEALRQSESHNRALISAIPDLIMTHNRNGDYLTIHAPDPGVLVAPPETMINRTVREFFPKPLADRALKSIADALDLNAVQDLNFSLRLNGRVRHFEARMIPCTPETVISLTRDVTERIRIDQQMRDAQKTETLGRLAGGVAHNFNNLLTVINGFGELARMELPAGHVAASHLTMALRAGDSATELVRQILAFTRRTPVFCQQAVDLVGLAQDTVALIGATLPAGVAIRLDLPSEPRSVLGETGPLQQVLINLCINGAQAMGSGGGTLQITVSDGGSTSPLSGPSVRLAVKDDGCGMDEEVQKMIFEPFFTTKDPGQGTGLGLSVAQGIVASHNGEIRVHSQPGKGSEFEVYLPLMATPGKAGAALPPTNQSSGGNGESVLIIDDKLSVLEFTRKTLEKAGYQAAVFTSATKGLSHFVAHADRYRLLIVDLSMPELSGIEVIREVRRHRTELLIFLISGDHGRADVSEVAADPMIHFLPKPFGVQTLLGLVNQHLTAPGGLKG